jgi:PAS domain S-box-containing protein
MEDDISLPQIVDSLSAPIATMTAEGRFDLVNKEFLDYFGMPIEALKDWETSGVVHPEDLPRVVGGANPSNGVSPASSNNVSAESTASNDGFMFVRWCLLSMIRHPARLRF